MIPSRSRPIRTPARPKLLASCLAALLAGLPLGAQEPVRWNDTRALELVARAREVRHETAVDSSFRSYQAEARGYVYFFIDRPDEEERTLVKADQVALEVYWKAPDQTKQRIIGLRDEKLLPTNIKYHLDHLTVVQDEFADLIRLGDGDEVAAVMHPAAHGSASVYDFRLADSLTLSFPGTATETVRVYEVRVRPRDPGIPGFIGSLFLDRGSGAIVRMNFTFTPSSYVDPYLDYIRISLDNALWEGKYWLPYRQEAELRRELPQLDFLAGSVIRGRFEIGEYAFNQELPDAFFRTGRVTAAPQAERDAFPFEDPLFAQLDEEGLSTPPSLEEIRSQARQMVAERYLSGLSRLRLHLPSASHAFRYNRAEGAFAGAGAVLRPTGSVSVHAHAGYGFSSGHASGFLRFSAGAEPGGAGLWLYANELRDLGPVEGASGVVNTLAALAAGEDYLDPWFASGVRLLLPSVGRRLSARVAAAFERHGSAALEVDDDDGSFRPVLPIEEGDLVAADLRIEAPAPGAAWSVGGDVRLARFEGRTYGRFALDVGWGRDATWRDLTLRAAARAALLTESAPRQELFLLGGRGTLLGHPYRGFLGDRFWLVDGEVSRSVVFPWVHGRLFAAAGWTELARVPLPEAWPGDADAGVKGSVGAGLGLGWDVLRLDLGRGLGDEGEWQLAFSVAQRFRGWL